MLTPVMQDYLKAIYLLQQQEENVSTSMLAEHKGVSAASVTGMLKKLSQLELVEYEPYRGCASRQRGSARPWKRCVTIACWSCF